MPKGKLRDDGTWENLPTGVPEEVVEWERVDNGAKDRSDWWKHAFRTDRTPRSPICGAKLRRGTDDRNVYYTTNEDGEEIEHRRRCAENKGMFPNGRCWRHGGNYPGAAVVHGRYMQSPTGPLGRAQQRAEADRKMLDLRPAIGLFDERLTALSDRIEAEGDTPGFRVVALRLFKLMQEAEKENDDTTAKNYRKELRLHLEQGTRADRAWTEILDVAERRAKRAERANVVLIQGSQVVSKREVNFVLARVLDVILEESDGASAARIQSRIAREVLGRIDPAPGGTQAQQESASLPRIQGEGVGVPEGHPRGETLEVSAVRNERTLPSREMHGEDEPRSREDPIGGVDRADLPDDEGGLDRDLDSPDGSSGPEPPLGGDREDAREGDAGTPW